MTGSPNWRWSWYLKKKKECLNKEGIGNYGKEGQIMEKGKGNFSKIQ